MESKYKYMITAAEITFFFAVGAISLASDRSQAAAIRETGISTSSTQAETAGYQQTQCPYCGCPYLYGLHQVNDDECVPRVVFAHACPYEAERRPQTTRVSPAGTKALLVDAELVRSHSKN